MYRLSCHCFVTRYIRRDCLMTWTIANTHIAPPCVICKMTATFVHMGAVACGAQNENSGNWMVTAVRCPTSRVVMDSWLVHRTMRSASIYIPGRFFGMLSMVIARMVEIISAENSVRRVPRMSLDLLYIAHTWRIITTAVTIRVHFSEAELYNNSQSAAPKKRRNVHPLTIPII
jgi:hypothetical protein